MLDHVALGTNVRVSGSAKALRVPLDVEKGGVDHRVMNRDHQIEKLVEFAADTRERLARLEASSQSIMLHMATKADLAQLESRMQRWFIGTAVALTGLAFAAGRFI